MIKPINPLINVTPLIVMLLTTASCLSEDNNSDPKSNTQKINPPAVQNLSPAEPRARVGTAISNTESGTMLRTAPSISINRPKFQDYIEGGSLKKTIKTNFMVANSYVVIYETKDEFPSLQAILLSPDGENTYKRITISSFPYEGGKASIQDVFFYDVDKDNAKEIFMIVTWKIEHKALGIDAMNYKILVCDNKLDDATGHLKQLDNVINRFGSGNDGELEEGTVSFDYKDRESILKALEQE